MRLLTSGAEGDRIVGLALIQEAPDAAAIEHVLPRLTGSTSAFEAYQALVAVIRLAPLLSPDQRRAASRRSNTRRPTPAVRASSRIRRSRA